MMRLALSINLMNSNGLVEEASVGFPPQAGRHTSHATYNVLL